jgi:AraC-like DNA-binding protein
MEGVFWLCVFFGYHDFRPGDRLLRLKGMVLTDLNTLAEVFTGIFRRFCDYFQNNDIMIEPLPFKPNTESIHFGFSSASRLQTPVNRLHRHDEIELGILEHGSVDVIIGRNRLHIPPDRFVVFWASQPHGPLKVTPGALVHVVHVPLPFVTEAGLPPVFLKRLLEGEVIFAAEGSDKDLPDVLLVKHWVALLAEGSPISRQAVLHEVIARLLRMANEQVPTGPVRIAAKEPPLTSDVAQRHFLSIMKLLADRCSEPWTIGRIASEVGLNPSYAMRLFRDVGGITIGACLMQQRIALAQRLLCTTDAKTLDIAFDCGFSSVSSFYEMFTRTCGQSPGKYRRTARIG